MSIIIGCIADNYGIIASDGREFDPAIFDKGVLVKLAEPSNEKCNKTFYIPNLKILGASAGITSFQGKTISTHISEIVTAEFPEKCSLEEIIRKIKISFKNRLEDISKDEILFEHRKIDFIFIGSNDLNFNNIRIYAFRMKPNEANDEILIYEEEIIPETPKISGHAYWKLFGDDDAQKAVDKFLKVYIKELPVLSVKILINLGYKAIRWGIKNCGQHKFGDKPSCGGKPFVRNLK